MRGFYEKYLQDRHRLGPTFKYDPDRPIGYPVCRNITNSATVISIPESIGYDPPKPSWHIVERAGDVVKTFWPLNISVSLEGRKAEITVYAQQQHHYEALNYCTESMMDYLKKNYISLEEITRRAKTSLEYQYPQK
jgi:hypothetical protein